MIPSLIFLLIVIAAAAAEGGNNYLKCPEDDSGLEYGWCHDDTGGETGLCMVMSTSPSPLKSR